MYVSGMIVAFVLSFIVFFVQGIQKDETIMYVIFGALLGSVLASILSWLAVALLVVMFASGKVWGISKE